MTDTQERLEAEFAAMLPENGRSPEEHCRDIGAWAYRYAPEIRAALANHRTPQVAPEGLANDEAVVEVIQADRDAAKSLLGRDDAGPSWWSIDSGNADADQLVQAFARHRQSHTALAVEEAVERLREALEPFARIPMHGKYGGPFVIAHAVYEDMTKGSSAPREAYWHKEDFERARNALAATAIRSGG